MDLFRSLKAPTAVSLVASRADGFIGGNPCPSREPNKQKQGMGELHVEAADMYDVPISSKGNINFL